MAAARDALVVALVEHNVDAVDALVAPPAAAARRAGYRRHAARQAREMPTGPVPAGINSPGEGNIEWVVTARRRLLDGEMWHRR